jgi:predicted acylesterase/phospholipase RssA
VATRFRAPGPKRILSLDGGGIRGILTLGILEQVEVLLRERHGHDSSFRLCDYFDLIAGTSTGSIIAALLAQGASVREAIDLYRRLASTVFARRWWRRGILLPRYDQRALATFLQNQFGPNCRLGDPERLRTGLLVVTKRIDTGSPWPVGNNPFGKYFSPRPKSSSIANRDYLLWEVVRASTAAPTFFAPQWIEIGRRQEADGSRDTVARGNFVDGGVSPHNNPALQAYLYATLKGYGIQWPTGADRLLVVSVGTGRVPTQRRPSWISAVSGVMALQSLMDDCSALVEALMQGMGKGPRPREIDPELQDLRDDRDPEGGPLLVDEPRFHYLRYDVKLYRDPRPRDGIDDDPLLNEVLDRPGLPGTPKPSELLRRMQQMDDPRPREALLELGRKCGQAKVRAEHFPATFDLPDAGAVPTATALSAAARRPVRRPYIRRPGQTVQAIQLTLATKGFQYEKWGSIQTCKQGDWIVRNGSDLYTVDSDSFERTYRPLGDGRYVKHVLVWAEPAAADGVVITKEGKTHYRAGDMLVFNELDGRDPYAISRDRFQQLYEPADES